MLISAFHTLVADEIKKATALAPLIITKTRQAVAEVQRRHNFIMLERFVTMTIDHTVTTPRAVSQPPGFKRMKFWRIAETDGSFTYVRKVDPEQVTEVASGNPTGYWLDGGDYFWFDNTPAANIAMEMSYTQNTDMTVATSTDVPFLDKYEALMLAETIVMLGPQVRDDRMVARYTKARDVLMLDAIREDTDRREAWDDAVMMYDGAR